MYLSKLELHGFKSFAERTVLQFDPGITAIVGPNGCGKSNIVDAVRWVIGEQRARILRSEKMENVIFNGTSKRRPLGMAEVVLTVENTRGVLPTEYTEVQLGRRLYRSGDSEYLLNGVQCRLKDITDLFMDTGMGAGAYSVIELKMIEDILSENAEDRRRLFEEAAGITKYKLRRRQTLGKLDSTQADLTRVRDLTEEIGKRVRSLKRQAEKAGKYRGWAVRLKELELQLARVEYQRLSEQESQLQAELSALRQQIDQAMQAELREEATLEKLRLELVKREQALAERQRALNRHLETMRSVETDHRLAQERFETAQRDLERTERDLEDTERRRAAAATEAERLHAELAAADPALAEATAALEQAQAERDHTRTAVEAERRLLDDLRRDEQQAADEHAGLRRLLDRLVNRMELLEREAERTQHDIDEAQRAAADLTTRRAAAAEQLEAARAAAAEARTALDAAERERAACQEAVAAADEALRQVERQREAVAAEVQLLDSLVSSYEEFPDTVRFLAAAPGWTPSALRTVADVLACNAEDRIALDAALGAFASCVVVQTEAEARQAVGLLRREQKGQATFIVLDRLSHGGPLPEPVIQAGGVTATSLRSAVRTAAPAFDALADLLLHDVYVVDTLEEARTAAGDAPAFARFVARTGEWTDARGLLHGGSEQAAPSPVAGRLGRREQLDAARETLAALDAEQQRCAATLEAAREALAAVPYAARREALAQAERAVTDAEKAHARIAYEHEMQARRRAELDARAAASAEELATGRGEAERRAAAVREAEQHLETQRAARAAAEQAFQSAEAAHRTALGRFNEASIAAVQARNRHDNLARDHERARTQITNLAAQAEAHRAHLARLAEVIATTRTQHAELASRLQALRETQRQLEEGVAYTEEAVRQAREAIANVEAGLRNQRRSREELARAENQRAVRLAEVQTRRNDLEADLREHEGISLADDTIEVAPDFDERAARAEVHELRQQIRALGAVNELALEAYEEENTRYEFLLTQQKDLEEAEGKLLEAIDEINTTASQRFAETYAAIEANFKRIFEHLFGTDAAAHLEMLRPDDPLETPIEIHARPKGKRPSSISQLSGGEKTLTAIALLFAIYLVKPSPFCILDEVDAPLDDANVERFMRLIREFSVDTQFILVTHNKRTMEAADRLYGITMQEQGVSRLVGVKFDEAAELVS